jgi:WD40 repeat protein/energy-coupling factor transporter ATP-binding protein EcfA2
LQVSRQPFTLFLALVVALVSVALNVVTNYLTSAQNAPGAFSLVRQWSLPALGVLVLLLLAGQTALIVAGRPPKRRWNADRPPYPGLEAFTTADAGVFFGRDAEIEELLGRLNPTSQRQAERFVAVVGPSGSGKSSLVHAGLVPQLAGRRQRWVVLPAFEPEDRPIWNLARCLTSAQPALDLDEIAGRLSADPAEFGRQIAGLRTPGHVRAPSVLLVIDQAEELFTLSPEPEMLSFLELLRRALQDHRRLSVIATLRSDFLDEFISAGFTDLVRSPVVVGPIDRATLHRVIEEPAEQAGLKFGPGLVSMIVDDTGGGDALPLLAYTMESLYRSARGSGTVTASDYRRLGGVAGALSKQADQVVDALSDVDRESVLLTLLRFVALDESGPVARRMPRRALNDIERRTVDAFVEARLLTSSTAGGEAIVEVAHEALFRQWPPLRQAVEARADELHGRAELERWAQDWERSGRGEGYLLSGERLETAERWATDLGGHLDDVPLVREFLEHSRHLDQSAMIRLSESVAREALAEIDRDPELSILLALGALEECFPTPLANRALVSALTNPVVRVLRGHRSVVRAVAWSPDGGRIVTGAQDGEARLWDARRDTELAVLRGHDEAIWAVVWSPDGERIATASDDRTVRIWDAEAGHVLTVLQGHTDWVRGVAWSPDGRRLATASHDQSVRIWSVGDPVTMERVIDLETVAWDVVWSPDGTRIAAASPDRCVRIWDAEDGSDAEVLVLQSPEEWVSHSCWSPDGRRLATASPDRTVRVWEPGGETAPMVLRGHSAAVWSVAWAPDGRRLASASRDRSVRLWDTDNGDELDVLSGHADAVQAVAWSPGGDLLVSGSRDRTARIWQAERTVGEMVLRGHTDAVQAVAWSPDGSRLATASGDHTALIWDPQSVQQQCRLAGHDDALRAIAWSPDGTRIVTVSDDRSARVWDARDGRQLILVRHSEWLRGTAWSPDGSRIATVSRDRLLQVWEADTGQPVSVMRGHTDEVDAVAWSPDSALIATVSGDRTARIWDATGGEELQVLQGHEEWVWCVSWSPDGRWLLTASDDHTARIWDVSTWTQAVVLRGHPDMIRGATWSPDSRHVATGSYDGTARIWDAASGSELAIVFVSPGWVSALGWSPDGSRLAIGAYDRAVIQDAVTSLDVLRGRARGRVSRQLTDEERRQAGLPARGSV